MTIHVYWRPCDKSQLVLCVLWCIHAYFKALLKVNLRVTNKRWLIGQLVTTSLRWREEGGTVVFQGLTRQHAGWLYLGEDGRRCVAVASECFMQLLQFDQHRSLVLVSPQRAISDQTTVMVQRAAVAGRVQPAVLLDLLGFGWETL